MREKGSRDMETTKARQELLLSLVVPMYNEEDRAPEAVDPLLEFARGWAPGSRVVFVDDGSTDRTVEVVTQRIQRRDPDTATILRRPHAGKGAAVRAGLRAADGGVAAFCDVDLATPLGELERVILEAVDGGCLAIASRAADGATIDNHEERRRELAGKAFNKLVKAWLCPGVLDTQCGAKAAPAEVWRKILPYSQEDGFAWDVEVIAAAVRLAIPVREIGVRWNHDQRTRVHVYRDGLSMVLAVPRISLALRRACADVAVAGADVTAAVDSVVA
jgi:dolichyl-phosphate beta-glucosyltransferase